MRTLQEFTRAIPVGIPVGGGRRRDYLMKAVDPLLRRTVRDVTINTPVGGLRIDGTNSGERLLAYAFHNVWRYYARSPLGEYIARRADAGTFVDVGANLGMYTLLARHAGMSTVAVEPEPQHAGFMQRNAAVFGTVLPVAFSDQAGDLPLYYHHANPGATSLLPLSSYERGAKSVPVRTFSEAAAAGDLGDPAAITLVKVDVEGFEAEVVAGMSEYLASGHRPHIWCEVRGDRAGRAPGSHRRVMELLMAGGYRTFDPQSDFLPIADSAHVADRKVFDLLFLP